MQTWLKLNTAAFREEITFSQCCLFATGSSKLNFVFSSAFIAMPPTITICMQLNATLFAHKLCANNHCY